MPGLIPSDEELRDFPALAELMAGGGCIQYAPPEPFTPWPVPPVRAHGQAVAAAVWLPAVPSSVPGAERDRPWPLAEEVESLLWLRTEAGAVRVFRLPRGACLHAAAVLAALLQHIAEDPQARRHHVVLPERLGHAIPLHQAPLAPDADGLPYRPQGLEEATRLWCAGLDQEPVRLLGAIGAPLTVDNARRLAQLPAPLYARWRQALLRFPALLAPLLLVSMAPSHLRGGRSVRGSARPPQHAVAQAVARGRDLTGALAAQYGIRRALARAPLWRQPLPGPAAASDRRLLALADGQAEAPAERFDPAAADLHQLLPRLLALLDGMPAQAWPADMPALLRHARLLRALLLRLPTRDACRTFAARWLRGGLDACAQALARYGAPDTHAGGPWRDADDFAEALGEALAAVDRALGSRVTDDALRTLALLELGPRAWLRASQAWHAALQRQPAVAPAAQEPPAQDADVQEADAEDAAAWPAVLGQGEVEGVHWHELPNPAALVEEGARMWHCVGSLGYAEACRLRGHRIVHLHHAARDVRATAQFAPAPMGEGEIRWSLVQLRGVRNGAADAALAEVADGLLHWLNSPAAAPASRAALAAAKTAAERDAARRRRPAVQVEPRRPAPLDAASQALLARLLPRLRAQVLAPCALPLDCRMVGFEHLGLTAEAFAPGQQLTLEAVEEEDPFDPCAVRLYHDGRQVGWVARGRAAGVQAHLRAGRRLSAQVRAVEPAPDEDLPLAVWIRIAAEDPVPPPTMRG